MHKTENGLEEPFEKVIIDVPDEYCGTVINAMNVRKGTMENMFAEKGYTRLEFVIPTRGLLGYRSQFINETRGEGTMVQSFYQYMPHAGEVPKRQNGVLIAQERTATMAYALFNLSERATMFVEPAVNVYEGMIVGMNSRRDDMIVNPGKNKKLTNVRASGSDDAVKLRKPRVFTLEEALEFIEQDELVEVTPAVIRLRKRILDAHERHRYNKVNK